jgi:hypothetical protein
MKMFAPPHGLFKKAALAAVFGVGFILEGLSAEATSRETAPAAADPWPEWPEGPRIGRAPEFAAWTITISPVKPPKPGPSPSPPPLPAARLFFSPPKLLRTTRTGNILRQERVDATGTTTEMWTRGAIQTVLLPEDPNPVACEQGSPFHALFSNLRESDFPELGWVQNAQFQGIHPFAGRDCLIFRATGPDAPGGKALACIDKATRLPAATQWGNEQRIYRFLKPPKSTLKPPQAVQEYFERRENAWRSLQRPLPSP